MIVVSATLVQVVFPTILVTVHINILLFADKPVTSNGFTDVVPDKPVPVVCSQTPKPVVGGTAVNRTVPSQLSFPKSVATLLIIASDGEAL